MDLDLTTYGREVLSAYERVRKSPEDAWALFGYDRNGCSIKVLATGGSLESLCDEFHDGKIQYGFSKVMDMNKLAKLVLIAWCGEGVPEIKKGFFSSHLEIIQQRFRGYHLQIHARSEKDLDPEDIRQRLKDLSGGGAAASPTAAATSKSTYMSSSKSRGFAEVKESPMIQSRVSSESPRIAPIPPAAPVRNLPQRAEASREQDPSTTGGGGGGRSAALISLFEGGRHHERSKTIASSSSITSPASKTAVGNQRSTVSGTQTPPPQVGLSKRAAPVVAGGERETRMAELEAIRKVSIGGSFTKSGYNQTQGMSPPEALPFKNVPRYVEKVVQPMSPREQPIDEEDRSQRIRREREEQFSREVQEEKERQDRESSQPPPRRTFPKAPRSVATRRQVATIEPQKPVESQFEEDDMYPHDSTAIDRTPVVSEETTTSSRQDAETHATKGLSARALFDYEATEENEISFQSGETLHDIDKSYDTWWYGRNERGDYGLFPGNFVEILSDGDDGTPKEPPLASRVSTGDAQPVGTEGYDAALCGESGFTGRALYDYHADDATEMGFQEGDLLSGIETIDDDWWRGYDASGNLVVFPANYIELIETHPVAP